MPRGKPLPPAQKGRSKEQLFNAETSVTSTDDIDEKKPRGRRQKGERVEAPSPELLPHSSKHDWGKIGVFVAIGLAVAGAIYSYADLESLARNTADDVKELKRKADELLRSSLDASARIGALERRDSTPSAAPPASTPTSKHLGNAVRLNPSTGTPLSVNKVD
jgi:hypothetical protein